jgi:hypothetical protein
VGEGNLYEFVNNSYKRRKRETAREGCKKQMSTETKKVNLELEIDTSTVDSSKNRYQGLIDMARAVDAWRIFPRLFLTVYIILLYKCVIWYMNLGAPTMEQSGLISIVVGAGAAWFGLYTGTSKSKK